MNAAFFIRKIGCIRSVTAALKKKKRGVGIRMIMCLRKENAHKTSHRKKQTASPFLRKRNETLSGMSY